MLQERSNNWEIQVVAGDNGRKSKAEAVAYDLKRDVVDVGAMTWEKYYRVFSFRCEICNGS
jgi:hypothetical protein